MFSLVQLCASATGKPLTDDELRLIAGYPRQLALLFPGQLAPAGSPAPEIPAAWYAPYPCEGAILGAGE